MAISKNILLANVSGKLGNLRISQRRGKTIISVVRQGNKNDSSTRLQDRVRGTFQQAIHYAKAVIRDSELKNAYQRQCKPGQSAYNRAIADVFGLPQVLGIDTFNYTGQPGEHIQIQAMDDFKVVRVKVFIYTAQGDWVEQGDAIAEPNDLFWSYQTTARNPLPAGSKIKAVAVDMPGNEGPMEITLI